MFLAWETIIYHIKPLFAYILVFRFLVPTAEVLDSLQDQLNAANMKASDYRNQVQALKQDMIINKVKKLISGEQLYWKLA